MHHMLAGAAAGLQRIALLACEEPLQHRPDRRVIAMKGRGIEPAVGLDRPAVLAEFHDIFRHLRLRSKKMQRRILPPFAGTDSPDCQNVAFVLFHPLIIVKKSPPETSLISPAKFALAAVALALSAAFAQAQSGATEGQKIAFDRGKGNCLTCHDIKGGDLPGTIGPALKDIKRKYTDRNNIVAI